MGGRGSVGKRHSKGGNFDIKPDGGQLRPIHVAGMNRDIANGVTQEKTLSYIEKIYKKGMNKEQLQILDEDGWVIRAYQGEKHSVAFDPDEVRGRVVTHNHPSRWGGTFSGADIRATGFGIKEIRASANEGVYSLKATRKADSQGLQNALRKALPQIDRQMEKVADRLKRMKIVNPQRRATINRRLQLNVLHRWYQKNAEKYGFEYQFTRNRDFKI